MYFVSRYAVLCSRFLDGAAQGGTNRPSLSSDHRGNDAGPKTTTHTLDLAREKWRVKNTNLVPTKQAKSQQH